jgi:hypothetical protein
MYFIIDRLEDNICVARIMMKKGNTANNELSPIRVHWAQDTADKLKFILPVSPGMA